LFNYVLKRVDATLDDGNVDSTAGANVALFTSSVGSCSMTEYQLYLASDTSQQYSGTDIELSDGTDMAGA
jgi:hypothetical protein